MNEFKEFLSQNINAKKLDLSNKKINDCLEIFQELEKLSNLQELDISGNELTYLPENLSNLKNLKVLDITNNLFDNFDKVSTSLETLPKLVDLKINLSTQNEALAILSTLPNLIFLNGKSTKEDDGHIIDLDEKDIENISFDKEELEKFNKMFQKVCEKTRTLSKEMEKKNHEKYQGLLKKEIDKINNCIESVVPNYVYACEILRSKLSISNFLIEKFIEFNEKKDTEITCIYKEIFNSISITYTSLFDVLEKLFPKISEKTIILKSQLDTLVKDANGIEGTINGLEEKIKQMTEEKKFLVKQQNDEREIFLERIKRLDEENKVMTDKILKKTKDLVNESTTSLKKFEDVSSFSQIEQPFKSRSNINMTPLNNNKVITRKLMKDTIDQLYESKANFDKKCFENKISRETMEQYMYTYLNHKYGIKTLIIEWASSIINGIKLYSNEDNDICVFGKILRNECEEDYRNVMTKIKNTIQDLLGFYLKGKYPLKSSGDIREMVVQKINSSLQEEEWREIIFYMYEENDANNLFIKLTNLIKRKYIDTKPPVDQKKMTREEIMNMSRTKDEYKIPFNDFQKVILDFQLKSHDKFLRNFIYVYKKIDIDNNGVLSEEEFIRLIDTLNVYKKDVFNTQVTRLLNTIDPFNKKQTTFSDIVSLLNNEFIEEDDGQGNVKRMSLLEKISLDKNLLQ